MANRSIFAILMCACLVQVGSAMFGGMFGANGFMSGFGRRFGGRFGRNGGAPVGGRSTEAVCNNTRCIPYVVLQKTATYELRRYEAMTVAETSSTSPWVPAIMNFGRLRKYLRGNNAEALRLNLTYPTISPQEVGAGSRLMLYVPTAVDEASPPEPTSPRVKITTLPAMEVYVTSHQTSMFDSDSADAIQEFKTALGPRAQLVPNKAYVAEYNTPMDFMGKWAEIWLVSSYPTGPLVLLNSTGPLQRPAPGGVVDVEPTQPTNPFQSFF